MKKTKVEEALESQISNIKMTLSNLYKERDKIETTIKAWQDFRDILDRDLEFRRANRRHLADAKKKNRSTFLKSPGVQI